MPLKVMWWWLYNSYSHLGFITSSGHKEAKHDDHHIRKTERIPRTIILGVLSQAFTFTLLAHTFPPYFEITALLPTPVTNYDGSWPVLTGSCPSGHNWLEQDWAITWNSQSQFFHSTLKWSGKKTAYIFLMEEVVKMGNSGKTSTAPFTAKWRKLVCSGRKIKPAKRSRNQKERWSPGKLFVSGFLRPPCIPPNPSLLFSCPALFFYFNYAATLRSFH